MSYLESYPIEVKQKIKVDLIPFITLLRSEKEISKVEGKGPCVRVLEYLNEFYVATIILAQYDAGNKTIEMVVNQREYYISRMQLYLAKFVRTICFLNSVAKQTGNSSPIIYGYVNQRDIWECDKLALQFHKAIADYLADPYGSLPNENVKTLISDKLDDGVRTAA